MKTGDIQFEVIVGTYEEFVLGYQFSVHDGNKRELVPTFATHSHRASVRSVACGGKLVVSGGADETINIYNMVTRKECGMLMEHNGTITSLSFTPDQSHLISSSEDGTIKIFRQGSWQMEKLWSNAHKGTAVTCLSVHPSGKMALSVGKDHTLRTWNLVKGRPAYTTNLYSRCRQLEMVVWSPGGRLFAIPMDCQLELSSTDIAGVLKTIKLPTKITACVFLSDEVMCVGEASGEVSAHSTESAKQLWNISGNERVRGLAFLHGHFVSATSSGSVHVYSAEDVSRQPKLVASTDTGCRITCVTLFDYKREMSVKKESDGKVSLKTKKKKNKLNDEKSDLVIESDDATSKRAGKNVQSKEIVAEVNRTKQNKTGMTGRKSLQTSSSSFIEIDSSEIKENKNKNKRSSFVEEEIKAIKKQKTSSNPNVCSPNNKKWKIEDSKR